MRDVTVLANEEKFTSTDTEQGTISEGYRYDGNKFRTVYDLTEEDIKEDVDKYLDYDASTEPTVEQLTHDRELIDDYTEQLTVEGLI
jgi:hypothetical protein